MTVRANSLVSRARVIREYVVLPSTRIDSVGGTVTLTTTRDSWPSEASAKIATALQWVWTDALNLWKVGVLSVTLGLNRPESSSGTTNGASRPGFEPRMPRSREVRTARNSRLIEPLTLHPPRRLNIRLTCYRFPR